MNEYQFEQYNTAVRDLRNQQNPPEIENVIKAFKKGINDAPGVLFKKLEANGRALWINPGALIWNAVTYVIKAQAAGIVVCGLIGGIVTAEVPLVGAVAGAAIGFQLANAYLALIGLRMATELLGQVAGTVSIYFEEGIRIARSGNVDGGAKQFAEAFAQIMQSIIALFILCCFAKGGQKVVGKMKALKATPRLVAMLKNLPPAISNFQAFRNHPKWGYAYQEIVSLQTMSLGDNFYAIRTCNPGRLKVAGAKGVALQAKVLEIKGKSFEGGIYKGEVGVTFKDYEKLKLNYEMEPIKINPNLVSGPQHRRTTSNMTDAGYRLKLKPGKEGLLDNHILESASHVSGMDGAKWRLLDKVGNPHIPDMDRLICMKLNPRTMKLEGMAKFMDDPQEIARFINSFNQNIAQKHRINIQPITHGYTAATENALGELIWHATTNETLLIFAGGKMFEMTWNQLVLFCDANRALNMPNSFKLVANKLD